MYMIYIYILFNLYTKQKFNKDRPPTPPIPICSFFHHFFTPQRLLRCHGRFVLRCQRSRLDPPSWFDPTSHREIFHRSLASTSLGSPGPTRFFRWSFRLGFAEVDDFDSEVEVDGPWTSKGDLRLANLKTWKTPLGRLAGMGRISTHETGGKIGVLRKGFLWILHVRSWSIQNCQSMKMGEYGKTNTNKDMLHTRTHTYTQEIYIKSKHIYIYTHKFIYKYSIIVRIQRNFVYIYLSFETNPQLTDWSQATVML